MTQTIRRVVVALLLVLLPAAAAGPARGQSLRHEKYTLENGLTVILHEDRTLPVAAVNLWYRVGAKEEPAGRSGFAHLFEHLMFMGTSRVPGGDFDQVMEAGGGSNNATTSLDRTNYFSSGPPALLPTLLWLEADRLEDLARAMDTAKLDRQRDVVRNEIRQNVENTPYGRAGERLYRLMYPAGHPYHNAVYGTHEDLEAATLADVTGFFATYYVPNNASLVVAGDFDAGAIKPLIASLFGTIPRGQPVRARTEPPAQLAGVARETMVDRCQLPKVLMAFHSPGAYQAGDAEMELAAAVLGEGTSSRLYRRLVIGDGTCVSVSATQDAARLGSLFIVDVLTRPGADLAAVERAIDEELARFAAEGPTREELSQQQAAAELALVARLQRVEARADRLNEYEYYWGEPDSFQRDLDRYRHATVESVRDWARRTLTPAARGIIWVRPQQAERPASARDERPAAMASRSFEMPEPETFPLRNGVRVMLWRREAVPLVSVGVLLRPGRALDGPGRAGLAGLAAAMTEEGAGDRDAVAFAAALRALGATYSAGAEKETASASLTVLKRNFDAAVSLLADAIVRPRMAAEDWSRVKRIHLESLRQSEEEPAAVAARVGLRALFGDDHPYAWPVDGTPRTVEPLTVEEAKAAHGELFRPEHATILVAGDVTAEETRRVLDRALGDWGSGSAGAAAVPSEGGARIPAAPARAGGLRVVLVHRPEAVQTVIRFVLPGARLADPERVRLRLLNTLLGGSFTSRLNQNLREEHGYTYGAGSRFVMRPSAGYFVASSAVRADVTGAALKEFLAEFARLSGPSIGGDVSDAEAAKAALTLRQETVQSFATLSGMIGLAADLAAAGLPLRTVSEDLEAMERATAAELNALAPRALDLKSGVLVLVGDRGQILEQIRGLDLPAPVEVDVYGDPVVATAPARAATPP
jgi:predicted Zn-dependent peptidase